MCHMDQAPVRKLMAIQRAKEGGTSEGTCPEGAGENHQVGYNLQTQNPRNVPWGRGAGSGQEVGGHMGWGQATAKPQGAGKGPAG